MDWGAWIRETDELIATRTRELFERHAIPLGCDYYCDLHASAMVLDDVTFPMTVGGTVVGSSFLWAWADDTIPHTAKAGLERVRQFGVENGLAMLTDERAHGGLGRAKECVAIAARVLDAQGIWLDDTDDGYILFVLFEPLP